MLIRRSSAWTALAPLALALLSLPAGAFPNEPTGLGEARFGLRYDDVKQHFPGLEPLTQPPTASAENPFVLETHQVRGQTILGIPGCSARFYFANSIFYQLGFDCPPEAPLFEAVKESFGPPMQELAGTLHWFGKETAVSVDPRARRVSYGHRELVRAVQFAVMQLAQEVPQDPGAVAPGAAPTPPAPAFDREAARAEIEAFDWFDEAQMLRESLTALKSAEKKEDVMRHLLQIALHQEPRTVVHLEPYLDHPEFEVFDVAVSAIETVGGPNAVRVLGRRISPDIPKERRLLLVEALLDLRYEEGAATQLVKALVDPDIEVRREAAMNLALVGDSTAVPHLQKAHATEGDAETKRIFARALELLGSPVAPRKDAGIRPTSERVLAVR